MNYFFCSINPKDEWDIFLFPAGNEDNFLAHSKMNPGDIMILVVGLQDKNVESGAYSILECTGDLFKSEEYDGKIRNRINAKCLYHSGSKPFMTREELSNYVHFPLRVPVIANKNLYELTNELEKYI